MDTCPGEPGSTSPEPPRSSPTSDTTRGMAKAAIVSQSEEIIVHGIPSLDITDDDHSSIAGCMSMSSLTLLGSGNLDELESKHEMPADDDSVKLFLEDDQNLHSVQPSQASARPDNTASHLLSNTALEHQSLSNDFKDDSRSVQTFWTAQTTTGTYVTAQSVADYERWRDDHFENQLSNDDPIHREMNRGTAKDLHIRFNEATFQFLANTILRNSSGGISQENLLAIKIDLLPLLDPPNTATSLNDLLIDLLPKVKEFCSSSELADRTEEHIWEYAIGQPHLEGLVKNSRSTCKTFDSQWFGLLKSRGLILDPKEAFDWSGRGQHVQYSPEEEASIPLSLQGNLGFGATGIVDRVRCRRIDLARKTIRCVRNLTKREAAEEVGHLQRLQHQHIVRLVGTYMLKKKLSILMYPATECNLEDFLDLAHDPLTSSGLVHAPTVFTLFRDKKLLQMIGCLTNAMAFIHSQHTKHMDIKPTNILVDDKEILAVTKVYITDFGIARSYQSTEASFTDSPISYTRTYTAPEIAQQTIRGPLADVFSLGCVFMEIIATLLSTPEKSQRERLRQIRDEGADTSYQANVRNVIRWFEGQRKSLLECISKHHERANGHRVTQLLAQMLEISPDARPTAAELKDHNQYFACRACDWGPEPFKAA